MLLPSENCFRCPPSKNCEDCTDCADRGCKVGQDKKALIKALKDLYIPIPEGVSKKMRMAYKARRTWLSNVEGWPHASLDELRTEYRKARRMNMNTKPGA